MIYLGLWLLVLGVSVTEAASISQQTSGWCSPAVGQTGGNVTISCQGIDPQAMQRLSDRLNKSNLDLQQKTREANELINRINELSRQVEALQDKKLAQETRALLRQGKLDEADTRLRQSYISMADYHAIQTGMSYPEVVNRLGRPGVEHGRSEQPNASVVSYIWQNPDGSVLAINFINERVSVKTQGMLR